MAASTIASTEEFVRAQYAHHAEAGLPLAPTFRAILDTLLTETAKSVGQAEVRAAGVPDGTPSTVKLALRVIGDRYSDEVLRLILSLNDNGGLSNVH
jgi:hypothetical protein